MENDFNPSSSKEGEKRNSVNSESFPHVLLFNIQTGLSNNESNSSSPRLSRDLNAENQQKDFLPKDLINLIDHCSLSNSINEENNANKNNNLSIYNEKKENNENNEKNEINENNDKNEINENNEKNEINENNEIELNKKDFENCESNEEFDSGFFRRTITKFPKLEENTNISENASKYSLKDDKEDEFNPNSNKESSENLFTVQSNSINKINDISENKNQNNINISENKIQGYQNNNINQGIFDSSNSYVRRVHSEVPLNNSQLVPPEISQYYYTPPNNIKSNTNLLPYNLNTQNNTENMNQNFNNNKNLTEDNKFSFQPNSEIFSYDNNYFNQNINSQLHYSAGFGKRVDNNFMHNSINNNFMHNSINNFNQNQNKNKKAKKKRKHKDEDEYIIEMFGRRGWICEECNNFNYESRNKCNRCKIPKKAIKIKTIIDNNGQKELIDNVININHKDDWVCNNCKNVNYAFRLVCNRCQFSKEESIKASISSENNNL